MSNLLRWVGKYWQLENERCGRLTSYVNLSIFGYNFANDRILISRITLLLLILRNDKVKDKEESKKREEYRITSMWTTYSLSSCQKNKTVARAKLFLLLRLSARARSLALKRSPGLAELKQRFPPTSLFWISECCPLYCSVLPSLPTPTSHGRPWPDFQPKSAQLILPFS